ncbi:uncharacterized protein K444DRAFT_516374, partial [Hyaloscypha bicolor E]
PNYLHVIYGQPFQNYFFLKEGIKCYGIPVNINKLHKLQKEYKEWDINTYLLKNML